jgi:hypothetical protein
LSAYSNNASSNALITAAATVAQVSVLSIVMFMVGLR